MAPKNCFSSTVTNFTTMTTVSNSTPSMLPTTKESDWLDHPVAGLKVWQLLFAIASGLFVLVIFLCCCIRFRIPRTKEEIEADFVRKKIAKKFRRQLRLIQNSDMDEMDLKRALDRIRAEFKSDTESLAQSEALSVASLSSSRSQTYRKASDILIELSEADNLPESQSGPPTTRLSALIQAALATLRMRRRRNTTVDSSTVLELNTTKPPIAKC